MVKWWSNGWQSMETGIFMHAGKFYKLLIFLILALAGFRMDPEPDYRKEFGSDYSDAEELAAKIRPLLILYARTFQEDPALIESIVFPELIRYNRLYDVFETGSLCLLYSRFGSDYANFSIGYFQMKPDFAKSLEEFMANLQEIDWAKRLEIGNLNGADDFNHRMDRIRRLQDSTWEMRYLIAFIKCCRIKHHIGKNQDPQSQIRFLSTAYNAGWQLSTNEIHERAAKTFFHLEHFNPARKYNYSDIAIDRYKQLENRTAALP